MCVCSFVCPFVCFFVSWFLCASCVLLNQTNSLQFMTHCFAVYLNHYLCVLCCACLLVSVSLFLVSFRPSLSLSLSLSLSHSSPLGSHLKVMPLEARGRTLETCLFVWRFARLLTFVFACLFVCCISDSFMFAPDVTCFSLCVCMCFSLFSSLFRDSVHVKRFC